MNERIRDKWEKLYEYGKSIVNLAPWDWMDETQLIEVEAYEGLSFYLSVMGGKGLFQGIFLATSKNGICDFSQLQSCAFPSIYGLNYQKGILMLFETRENITIDNIEIVDTFMKRQKHGKVIFFESFVKGYMPSSLTEEELDDSLIGFGALDRALKAIDKAEKSTSKSKLVTKLKQVKKDFIPGSEKCLHIKYDEETNDLNLEVIDMPEITASTYGVKFPPEALKDAKGFNRIDDIFEIEFLNFLPVSVGQVNYKNPIMSESKMKFNLLRYLIITSIKTRKIIAFETYDKPFQGEGDELDYMNEAYNYILNVYAHIGIPKAIVVRDEQTSLILEDMCRKLKIELNVLPVLAIIDDFVDGFMTDVIGKMPTTNLLDKFDLIDLDDEDYDDDDDDDDDDDE